MERITIRRHILLSVETLSFPTREPAVPWLVPNTRMPANKPLIPQYAAEGFSIVVTYGTQEPSLCLNVCELMYQVQDRKADG